VPKSNKWYVMAAVATGLFLSTIDGSIVNITLPVLVKELNTSFAAVQWVVLAYLLTVTTLLLSIGRLGDILGKKPIYSVGYIIFTLGSVLCGLSPNISLLIAARVLQGLGAAMIMALSTAIVTEAFPPEERGRALGISGMMVSIGIITGPTLGGIIIQSLSWHWIFFVNLPVGIIGTLLVLRFVPNLRPHIRQQFDIPGAVMLFVSLMSFLLALTLGQDIGFLETRVIALLVAWLVTLVIFIYIEIKSPYPMVDLRLFRSVLFSINLATGFMTFVAASGTLLLMPFYLENVLRLGPSAAGMLMVVSPLMVAIVAPLSGALSDRIGTRPMTAIGLAFILASYIAISTLTTTTTPFGYALRYMLMGIGVGMFQSPNNSAVMGAVPRERLGVASSLLSITRTLGQVLGIATLGALWVSQVLQHAGSGWVGGATSAPAEIQVLALHESLLYVIAMMSVAFLLSLWALWKERSSQRAMAAQVIGTGEEF
jgi:EmrB/QacA subfamily drug resistance transporter